MSQKLTNMPAFLEKSIGPFFTTCALLIFTGGGWIIFFGAQAFFETFFDTTEPFWSYFVLFSFGISIFSYNFYAEIEGEVNKVRGQKDKELEEKNKEVNQIEYEKEIFKVSLLEKAAGFPTLLEVIQQFEERYDKEVEDYLRYKKHPSVKSAEVVKEYNRRRRTAEFEEKKTRLIIEYYESLAPFLLEYKNEIAVPEQEDILAEYTEEERQDETTLFLTKDEFRKLPTTEKNQLALERYWKRPKSKWLIGRMYERFVGQLYEAQGYSVEYTGIFKGLEDLGRDLICKKGNEIIIIQCKCWSQFKTIFEKHIFQFFGTVFQYQDENAGKKVRAIFYTTTLLSDLARRFAEKLNIELQEGFKMDNSYPCIKCNISGITKEKIYHLPFDQQYDKVKIEPHKGEFYCATVQEAESAGFRRAFRHKFNKGA